MSDPLSVLLGDGQSSSSAPATPSKSRISSRPPPYVRPAATSPSRAVGGLREPGHNGMHSDALHQPHSNVEQFPNGANQQYTSIVRSQSPLAPRPPLPGQLQRPVSPIQWQQSSLNQQDTPSQSHFSPQVPGQQAGTSSGPFLPTSPNAWASSLEPATSQTGSSQQQRQYLDGLDAPVPSPVPVPPPVGSLNGPARPLGSPGIPRSPVAENPTRPILSSQYASHQNGQGSVASQEQQQAAKVPPYLRVRVTGIDRAKKELGIKMDAQTNISTYHRRQSPVFERTYNEFLLLHAALSANHPETILPALPLSQTSAANEEEEDRFLKGVFQKFMDRLTKDRSVILDDELRSFIEADFGYTPLTKAKRLKAGSGGFLSRSSSKPLLGEDGEPDFLVTSKVHSAALEGALSDTCKTLEKVLKHQTTCASSYAELAMALSSFSTTETHPPLTDGMKALAEAMTHIAQLETGQTNATALVLGDSLAYEMVEARSAKDALLQRQYNIDELRNSIKTTINKRRAIEKMRASGNIKPERVNEALDDLEEAAKHEQGLQHKVEAISRNLRPALQTHLRTMNDDMLSIALGQARTMLAYENRKLQIYDGIHAKIATIPERGANDQSVVYYPQSQSEQPILGPAIGSTSSAPMATQHSGPGQASTSAQGMSPSVSQHKHLSASTTDTADGAHSKFMATQAAIKAEMQAQREREERQRAQFIQARQYQHQKQASIGRASAAAEVTSSGPVASTSSLGQAQPPTSPKVVQQAIKQPQSPLHAAAEQPQSQERFDQNTTPSLSNMSQSMFVPSQQQQNAASIPSHKTPRSPSRLQRTASITHARSSGIDPLSPGGPIVSSSSTPSYTSSGNASYQQQTDKSAYPNTTHQHHRPQGQAQSQQHSQTNGNMTQSVFLPGRSAQPGFRPASQPPNVADERKRADARKAASFLAGAF